MLAFHLLSRFFGCQGACTIPLEKESKPSSSDPGD